MLVGSERLRPEAVEGLLSGQRGSREAMRVSPPPTATIMRGMGRSPSLAQAAVDVVRGLASLALIPASWGGRTSAWGRSAGNYAVACDMGVLPNLFPGYQEVHRPRRAGEIRRRLGCRPGADGRRSAPASPRCRIKR